MAADKRLWQRYAQGYDHTLQHAAYRKLQQLHIEAAGIRSGMWIVDLGCGTANLLVMLEMLGLKCHVVGIDSTPEMLDTGQRKAAAYREFGGTVELIRGDLNKPPSEWNIESGWQFDAGICNNVLYILDDPTRVFDSAASLLKPGARFSVSTPGPDASLAATYEEHAQLTVPEPGPERDRERTRIAEVLSAIEKDNRAILATSNFHFVGESDLLSWAGPEWTLVRYGHVYGIPPQNHHLVVRRKVR